MGVVAFDERLMTMLQDVLADLPDCDDQMASAIAETNACGYYLDWIEPTPVHGEVIATFASSGPRKDDCCFCGDTIHARVKVDAVFDGVAGEWKVNGYEVLSAEVEDWGD